MCLILFHVCFTAESVSQQHVCCQRLFLQVVGVGREDWPHGHGGRVRAVGRWRESQSCRNVDNQSCRNVDIRAAGIYTILCVQ